MVKAQLISMASALLVKVGAYMVREKGERRVLVMERVAAAPVVTAKGVGLMEGLQEHK